MGPDASSASVIDHTFSSFMIPSPSSLAERNGCFYRIYRHPYVLLYCTSAFPFYPACFHRISETVIVVCDVYWQSATRSVQYGSVKVVTDNHQNPVCEMLVGTYMYSTERCSSICEYSCRFSDMYFLVGCFLNE